MANQIDRDVYVLSSKTKIPIDYVRLTNDIPIVLTFRDYDIPEGATANVFVQKPSGTAVYASTEISGNVVTITVTDQMFAELGTAQLQVRITRGENILVSFSQPVKVHPNYTEGDAAESTNEGGFFEEVEEAIGNANEAAENANAAADSANTAAETANTAAETAENAANTANTAADNANEAADTANTAADTANTAASSANEAAENVNTAAEAAETAAENANAAADSANTAANTANTAAETANTAAETAENAAQDARDAADAAQGVVSGGLIDDTQSSTVTTYSSSKIEDIVGDAQDAAEAAQTTADSAVSAAEAAQTVADNAQNTADSAASAASTAQTTAEAAQAAAETAQSAAETAQSMARTADSTAESAINTANSAATAASTAQTTAEAAQAAAETAQSAAETAQSMAEATQLVPGDTMTAIGYYAGYITDSGTQLSFSIPCVFASSVTEAYASTNWQMRVRADGGYEVGSSDSATTINSSNISIVPRGHHLDVSITFSVARTNNIVVAVQLSSGTIGFS